MRHVNKPRHPEPLGKIIPEVISSSPLGGPGAVPLSALQKRSIKISYNRPRASQALLSKASFRAPSSGLPTSTALRFVPLLSGINGDLRAGRTLKAVPGTAI